MEFNARSFSRSEVRSIATQYATSTCEISASYFQNEYGITESVFYGILKRAVVESIVSMEAYEAIKNKSALNSKERGGEGGRIRSLYKYQRLLEKRNTFEFPISERKRYATEYAKSSEFVNSNIFCECHCIGKELFSRTIRSAIVDGIVGDDIVELLEKKALQNNDEEKVKMMFAMLREERNKKKEEKRERNREYRKKHSESKKNSIQEQASLAELEAEKNGLKKEQKEKYVQLSMFD